jgi:hypothetical protein
LYFSSLSAIFSLPEYPSKSNKKTARSFFIPGHLYLLRKSDFPYFLR